MGGTVAGLGVLFGIGGGKEVEVGSWAIAVLNSACTRSETLLSRVASRSGVGVSGVGGAQARRLRARKNAMIDLNIALASLCSDIQSL